MSKKSILTNLYFLTYFNFCAKIGKHSWIFHPKFFPNNWNVLKMFFWQNFAFDIFEFWRQNSKISKTLSIKIGILEQCGIIFFELYFFIRITDESEIPQGTLVFPNLSWIMHDENHFKTPETFDPQRFLHQELLKKNFVFSAWWTSDSIFYRETKLFRTDLGWKGTVFVLHGLDAKLHFFQDLCCWLHWKVA